jgi:Heterokaryon incompatibility protein (HET)
MNYVYEPLSPNSIRILRLQPGEPNQPLQVVLSAHQLVDAPVYQALSYAWGEKIDHRIECGGFSLIVQQNLWLALRALRSDSVERILWIDAICINQADILEKNSQILLMRRIYSQAQSVIVWLGDAANNTAEAWNLLSCLVTLSLAEGVSETDKPATAELLASLNLPEPSNPEWRALDELYWRSWFTRVWIIQEIAVSKEALVLCGGHSCPWSHLQIAAEYIANHSLNALTDVDPRPAIKLATFVGQIHRGFEPNGQPLLPEQRFELFLKARDSYATDDRDKVFALQGLIFGTDQNLPAADYSETNPTSKAFVKFAEYLIGQGSLDVLSAVEDHRHRLNDHLPSWTPDWEVHPPSVAFCLGRQFANWKAAGNMEMSAQISHNNKTLNAVGFVFDTVDHVSDSFLEYVPLPGTVLSWSTFKTERARRLAQSLSDFYLLQRWRQWDKLARNLKRYPNGEDLSVAFIRTLVADAEIKIGTEKTNELLETYYAAWCKYWVSASIGNGKFIREAYERVSTDELAKATRFMEAHYRAAYARRFFTTKGRFMGLCPSLTRSGDKVVVLGGGKTPYILRKGWKSQHTFIGECYVHGIMHGESLGQGMKTERFVIR